MLPGEGKHEEDCDCDECRLNEYRLKLTEFERFCWTWYHENVNAFTLEAGVAGDAIKELGLAGLRRRLFLTALNMIHQNNRAISNEQVAKEMDKRGKSNG